MKEHRPGAMDFAVTMMLAHNNPNKYRRSLRTLYGGKNIANDPDKLDDEENAGITAEMGKRRDKRIILQGWAENGRKQEWY